MWPDRKPSRERVFPKLLLIASLAAAGIFSGRIFPILWTKLPILWS